MEEKGSILDDDPVSDDSTRFSSFTPIMSVHEAAGAKQGNSLHDRFTALASPPSGSRRIKLKITTNSKYSHDFIFWPTTLPLVSHPIEVVLIISDFDFLSTRPTESTTRNREQKNGSLLGNTDNHIGASNMGSRELQDKPESEHENKPPSSIKSPGSYKLNPLASTFDASAKKQFNFLKSLSEFTPNKSQINPFTSPLEHTPTKVQFNPFAPPFDFTPIKVQTETTFTRTKTGTDTEGNTLLFLSMNVL